MLSFWSAREALAVRRREFITVIGGAAAAWPLAARAQQGERMRRIGVLMPLAVNDPEAQARLAEFSHELERLGWSDGRNLQIHARLGPPDVDRGRKDATELATLAPSVILANGSAAIASLQL